MRVLFILFFVSLLIGCSTQEIQINSDNSAHVKLVLFEFTEEFVEEDLDDEWEDEPLTIPDSMQLSFDKLKNAYSSKLIKNLSINQSQKDSSSFVIEFDISPIDSLGNYLDPIFDQRFQTSMNNNSFTFVGSDGLQKIEEDVCGCTNLLTIKSTINFDKNIKKLETKNNYIKQTSTNQIEINTSIGEMNFSGIENKFIVTLEDQ